MEELWLFASEKVVPGLNAAFLVSLKLIIPSAIYGSMIGIVVGAFRVYGNKVVQKVLDGYVSLFRGSPLVVQLFFWYFALPYISFFGHRIVMDAMQASIFGFALCSGAYQSEYIRGGLLSIRSGQIKAAKALGMSPFKTVAHVVLPQAVRRALPGCCNEIIYLIKYSSLASIITVNELTGMGRSIAKATWRPTETYLVVGIYYLVIVTIAMWLLRKLERELEIPGFERPKD